MILGIDPGTATTGFGFVRECRNGDLEAVDYGVILTPPDLPMEKRLLMLYQQLKEKILFHQPITGAVEKLFFQRNVTTAISVGQARGVILLAMAEVNLPTAEYTPNEIKQAVAGYGGADKKQMQVMVKTLLNLETIPKPDDAADALGVAICHYYHNRFKNLAEGRSV
jgi:crossover junction endodeoxyribonuclease RuvC